MSIETLYQAPSSPPLTSNLDEANLNHAEARMVAAAAAIAEIRNLDSYHGDGINVINDFVNGDGPFIIDLARRGLEENTERPLINADVAKMAVDLDETASLFIEERDTAVAALAAANEELRLKQNSNYELQGKLTLVQCERDEVTEKYKEAMSSFYNVRDKLDAANSEIEQLMNKQALPGSES